MNQENEGKDVVMRIEMIEEIPGEMKPYKPREDRELVKSDAADILRWLMATAPPQLRTSHGRNNLQRIIEVPFWLYGTCDGDYMIRFTTPEAIACKGKLKRHHIYSPTKTNEKLISHWGDVNYALKTLEERSTVCHVTEEQHAQLAKPNMTLDGLDRYTAAEITIIDRSDDSAMLLPPPVPEWRRQRQLEREKVQLMKRLEMIQLALKE